MFFCNILDVRYKVRYNQFKQFKGGMYMGTNIDLLIRMLKKEEYNFSDDVDNYNDINDVAFDENEVITLLERI